MAEVAYNRGMARILAGSTSLASGDLRMLLIAGGSLPSGWDDPDLNTVADLAAVAGVTLHGERVALVSLTVTQDDDNDRADADCADVVFGSAAGVTARAAVIYDEAGAGDDTGRHLVAGFSTGLPASMDTGLTVAVADWLRARQGTP